jgi:hypothetical protein
LIQEYRTTDGELASVRLRREKRWVSSREDLLTIVAEECG